MKGHLIKKKPSHSKEPSSSDNSFDWEYYQQESESPSEDETELPVSKLLSKGREDFTKEVNKLDLETLQDVKVNINHMMSEYSSSQVPSAQDQLDKLSKKTRNSK